MRKSLFLAAALSAAQVACAGVPVAFELPKGGLWQVSIAACEKDHPERIVSTFVAGEVFDSTVSNRFVVSWNGLDDNFMPCPPGEYAVKGICSPAHVWPIDGEAHAITARWVGGPGEFLPKIDAPDVAKVPIPFYGDPVNSPLLDVDTTPEGMAVLGFQYLENGRSCPLLDLRKPKGHAQFVRAFPSGGAGGGPCATTDGTDVWACSHDGAPWFVFRPDMKNFGPDNAPYRRGGYLPKGRVWDMACARFDGKSFVYVVERGALEKYRESWGDWWRESETQRADVVTVMTGDDGKILAKVPVQSHPTAVKVAGNDLYVLYRPDGRRLAIGVMAIKDGVPGGLRKLFDVPSEIDCEDFARDSKGNFFFPDAAKNKLFRSDAKGAVTGSAGRLARQVSGSYDPESMMAPRRLSAWRDKDGVDRILVVEHDGPNRISEWNAATLAYMGEYQNFQLKANCGFDADPGHPEMAYIPGHNDWLCRFKVDYATGEWKLDAVFDGVPDDAKNGLSKMKCFRVKGRLYFASVLSGAVFRLTDDGKRVVRAASVRDVNGAPAGVFTYHGGNFTEDLSYLSPAQGSRDVWRCSPSSFTAEGDPVYTTWTKVLSDPVFEAIHAGKATSLFGGNELAESYSSDWMQADETPGGDLYVHASGGPSYSANFRPQHKITRYCPDGKGGYELVWRVGRTQLPGSPRVRGQIAGGMRIFKPMNGIFALIDQSRSGVFLYTEDGIYVDTLFSGDAGEGVYVQPGEFFVGSVFADRNTGKIYYGSGKYTPFVYEIEGWSLKSNPVRPLDVAKKTRTVRLTASRTEDPPREALRVRKGLGTDLVAEFAPKANGWDGATPVAFSDDGDEVEVRCLYSPDALAFKWHVRMKSPFAAKPLQQPERLFNHDQGSDTVSVYFQGDADAPAGGPAEGRPGDVRFTCGLFADGKGGVKPVLVGFYPEWKRPGAKPQTYRTAAGGKASYAHVAEVPGASVSGSVDEDGKGFTLVALVPRSEIPVSAPFSSALRTRVNFDANLGGHHRFWWSNADGSASRETYDEPTESRFFPGSWSLCRFGGLGDGLVLRAWAAAGPFGGPGFERFNYDPQNKEEVRRACESAKYGPDSDVPRADAKYVGEQVKGYWKPVDSVGWEKQQLSVDGMRVKMGLGSQVWFATTAVWSPSDAEVEMDFYAHLATYSTWTLNGEKIDSPSQFKEENATFFRTRASKSVKLRKGWNVLKARAFCVGYPPFHIGARIRADEALLWKLKTATFAATGF